MPRPAIVLKIQNLRNAYVYFTFNTLYVHYTIIRGAVKNVTIGRFNIILNTRLNTSDGDGLDILFLYFNV